MTTRRGPWNSLKAETIETDVSAFNGLLTSSETNVQLALNKLDDAGVAASISLDTTNFNGILTATENTVQKALDAIDDMSSVKANFTVANGIITVGTQGGALCGTLNLLGSTYATGAGGLLGLINAATYYDTEIGYTFQAYEGNLIIGPVSDIDSLKYVQSTGIWTFTGAGGVDVANALTAGTVDADTDFTVGNTVITSNQIAHTGLTITGGTVTISGTSETLATFTDDGACVLYNNNVAVLSTTATGISITDGVATAATIGFSNDDLLITNNDADGLVYIYGTPNGGGSNIIFYGDPDADVKIYYAGGSRLKTSNAGVQVQNASSTVYLEFSSDDFVITNTDANGMIQLAGYKTGPTLVTMASFNPDGGVDLYYAGTNHISTTAAGFKYNLANSTTFEFTSVSNVVWLDWRENARQAILGDDAGAYGNFWCDATYARLRIGTTTFAQVAATAQQFGGTGAGASRITFTDNTGARIYVNASESAAEFDHNGAVRLYYDNVVKLATTATGVAIGDGTATAATIGFSSDDLVIDNNDVAGLIILKGEKTGPSEVTMASFNPDGAAELYYAGVLSVSTISLGIALPDAGKVQWDSKPASDDTCSGDISSETVDTNAVGIGAILYLASDGNYDEADADDASTCGKLVMAVESGTGTKLVMHRGFIHLASHGFTVGAQLYVSNTQGTMTNTAPSNSGDCVQVVGYATDANTIYFNPSVDYLEVA